MGCIVTSTSYYDNYMNLDNKQIINHYDNYIESDSIYNRRQNSNWIIFYENQRRDHLLKKTLLEIRLRDKSKNLFLDLNIPKVLHQFILDYLIDCNLFVIYYNNVHTIMLWNYFTFNWESINPDSLNIYDLPRHIYSYKKLSLISLDNIEKYKIL